MLSPMYIKRTLLDIADTDWYLIASRTEKIMSKLNTSTDDVGPADTGNLKIQRTKSGVLNLVLKQHQTIQPTPPIEEKDSQIITSKQALQRGRSSGRTSRKKKTKAQLPFLGHNTIEKGVSKAMTVKKKKVIFVWHFLETGTHTNTHTHTHTHLSYTLLWRHRDFDNNYWNVDMRLQTAYPESSPSRRHRTKIPPAAMRSKNRIAKPPRLEPLGFASFRSFARHAHVHA